MTRFRTLVVAAVALTCVGAAAAKGAESELTVRPAGARGPLVRYDLVHGARRYVLPAGMLSADGSRFASVQGRSLRVVAVRTREPRATATVPAGSVVEAVSKTGRFVAVRSGREVRILAGARTLHRLSLAPAFTVDALSPDGTRLYLIEHKGGEDYAVRQFLLASGTLVPRALVQKGEQEQMAGTPAGVLSSLDGTWQFTLYTNGEEREAFVHALNLAQAYTICLDLPGHGTRAQLRTYSLAVGPDGDLYAANPALGVLASFPAQGFQRAHVRRFAPTGKAAPARAAVSADGAMLAFSAGRDVWRVETPAGIVRKPVAARAPVLGLGFVGPRLYAVHAAGRPTAFTP